MILGDWSRREVGDDKRFSSSRRTWNPQEAGSGSCQNLFQQSMWVCVQFVDLLLELLKLRPGFAELSFRCQTLIIG